MAKQQRTPENNEDDKAKTSFYFRKDLQKKLKIISAQESKKLTDILEEAATDYISRYEKKNGEIKI